MRFSIGDRVYKLADVQELSLKHLLQLQAETETLGRRLTMGDIQAMDANLRACTTDTERAAHPDAIWVLAVSIWAGRVLSGEDITFADAIDFPMSQLTYLPEPSDRKQADPTRARPGSGRAAKRAAPARKTSSSPSTAA